MKKILVIVCLALFIVSCNVGFAQDQSNRDLVASIAELPMNAPLIELVKNIDEIYPGNIKITIAPMIRSVNNVLNGEADFHIPSLRNPSIPVSKLPYQFVSERIALVTMVVYSHQDNPITKNQIDAALAKGGPFPYKIEVSAGLEANFPFQAESSRDLNGSFLKLQHKRIDALVRNQEDAEVILKNLKLGMIHRSFYSSFDTALIVPKGPKGDELNRILSDCLKKLKASGKLRSFDALYQPYKEWQPSQMGW